MVKRLLKSIREYKRVTLLCPLFMIGEVAMEMFIPYKMADLIDIGFGGGDVNYIIKTGIILVIAALLSLAFGILGAFTGTKASAGFAKNLRGDMYRNIQTFSFGNIDKFSTSSLITRLTTDVNFVQMAFQMTIRMAIRTPITMIFAFIMTVNISWQLALIYAILIPVLLCALGFIGTRAHPVFKKMFKSIDHMNNTVQENLHGIRVVKSFVREGFEEKKFEDNADELYRLSSRAELILAWNNPVLQFAMYLAILLVSWFGAQMVINGAPVTSHLVGTVFTTGLLNSVFSYSMMLLMNCMMLSMIFIMLVMSRESMRRIDEVLQEKADIVNPEKPEETVRNGEIVFKNVDFSYKGDADHFCLSDVDLTIPSGATVGIIGGTGSSKSTLVQLIPRLYDATCGTVKVGGRDVRDYDLQVLRDAVSVVLQKNTLFSGTIKDNLRWGNPEATDAQMVKACEIACADGFIREFPDGYDTYIEQGGSNVSGGQRQRLCIARALMKDPKVLIMDDSTSAVDTATDAKMRKAFREDIPDITKIIIAQRISSVQDADMIVVMDGGRIDAVGTHDELLKSNEIYKEVFESQQKGGIGDGK